MCVCLCVYVCQEKKEKIVGVKQRETIDSSVEKRKAVEQGETLMFLESSEQIFIG